MEWFRNSLVENTGLDEFKLVKVLHFVLKSISATIYLFVLGYLFGGLPTGAAMWLLLLIAAILDLAPARRTLGWIHHLNPLARKMEITQLILKGLAYLVLLGLFLEIAPLPPFETYAAFAFIWILSFLVEQSALFVASFE